MQPTRRDLLAALSLPALKAQSPDWADAIFNYHPRLFFHAGEWPAVEKRALTANRDHYDKVRRHAESPTPPPYWKDLPLPPKRPGSSAEPRDWGSILMSAAFVYRIEPTPERLHRIRDMLWASLDYYNASYADNRCVHWYATTRTSWLAALDWVWDVLDADDRLPLGRGILQHVHDAIHRPGIVRRNSGKYTSGYYGPASLSWFAGIVLHQEGADDDLARELLEYGRENFMKLLEHRSRVASDDGGGASSTLGYTFNAYPWAEWNFLYTWESATGQRIAQDWPYIGLFPNYVVWNWLPGGREYGYGDTRHVDNKIRAGWRYTNSWLYTHMSHAMHFYARSHPEFAGLAAYVRQMVGGSYVSSQWSVYPFLMTQLEEAPPPLDVGSLPPARHFENMGQVFMRSGSGDDDTYAMFACGGILTQHRHYDANHFIIYKQGYLALDSGTRQGTTDNLQNYYAQTVAHNCILIKMPGEPPSDYWNGKVYGQAGGQYKQLGSKVIAFETSAEFTYVAGDATETYRPEKAEQVVRQFVFLPPNHFVVFDRVISTDAGFAKRWLLHHANEPVVDGSIWRTDQDEGRLFCRTLLPRDAVLEKVGGPGKEFLADGVNYSIHAGPSEEAKRTRPTIEAVPDEVPELMGRWRMEVKPGAERTGDVFLHVIEIGDQSLNAMSSAELRESGGEAGVSLRSGEKTIAVSFRTAGPTGGHIRIERHGAVLLNRELTRAVERQAGLGTV